LGERVQTTGFTDDVRASIAMCNTGDIVVDGGYEMLQASTTSVPPFIYLLGPTPTPTNPLLSEEDQGYIIQAGGGNVRFQAYAFCFDNSPSTTAAAASTVSAFQQPEESPILSQGIVDSPKLTTLEKQPEDSPELTATEKITKLKTQWLELLP
jgi:hypothetical protein